MSSICVDVPWHLKCTIDVLQRGEAHCQPEGTVPRRTCTLVDFLDFMALEREGPDRFDSGRSCDHSQVTSCLIAMPLLQISLAGVRELLEFLHLPNRSFAPVRQHAIDLWKRAGAHGSMKPTPPPLDAGLIQLP